MLKPLNHEALNETHRQNQEFLVKHPEIAKALDGHRLPVDRLSPAPPTPATLPETRPPSRSD